MGATNPSSEGAAGTTSRWADGNETVSASGALGTSILRKLLAVMKDCGYIQKDKKNTFHNYSYASEAAIKDRVHAALVEHGVIPQVSLLGLTEREITRFKDGKPQTSDWLTTANVHYKFYCVDTGEFIEGTFYGCGVDPSDKGLYKAITGAIKYLLTSQFLIPTGDDPEQDEGRTLTKEEKKGKQVEYLKSKGIDPQASPIDEFTERQAKLRKEGERILEEASSDPKATVKGKAKPKTTGVMSFERLKKMREMKDELRKFTGTDGVYYGILQAKGHTHANEISNEADAVSIWKVLGAEVKRLKDEAELLALFDHSTEIIGQRAFSDCLGAHGVETIQDALKLAGDPLAAFLSDLKQRVDQRRAGLEIPETFAGRNLSGKED